MYFISGESSMEKCWQLIRMDAGLSWDGLCGHLFVVHKWNWPYVRDWPEAGAFCNLEVNLNINRAIVSFHSCCWSNTHHGGVRKCWYVWRQAFLCHIHATAECLTVDMQSPTEQMELTVYRGGCIIWVMRPNYTSSVFGMLCPFPSHAWCFWCYGFT